MIKILRHSEIVETRHYCREWGYDDGTSCGFSFPSDASGNIDESKLSDAAKANLRACHDGAIVFNGRHIGLIDKGVVTYTNRQREPAIGECACGREVVLAGFTNACECGRDYNSAGQELAPREQWGEETGESLADILRIP